MQKKVIRGALGAFVVLTFVIYSIHQRGEASQASSHVSANTNSTSTNSTTDSSNSPTPTPVSSPSSSPTYKNGTYTGKSADAFYGFIQVKAIVSGGKLTDVEFLDYPQDRGTSVEINQQAMPILKSQAIQAQSAQVDGVSGATDSSQAFTQSLSDALAQARA